MVECFEVKSRYIVVIFLAVELLDELVFGLREAAWPLIRDDLCLNYIQIGVLLSLPGIVSGVIELFIGVLGDIGHRRLMMVAGGVVFACSLVLTGVSTSYSVLLMSFLLFAPASGAFVSLSQANLMDFDPEHRERNMAKWTFAGSVGNVVGPLILSLMVIVNLGWRIPYHAFALIAVVLVLFTRRCPERKPGLPHAGLLRGLKEAMLALRRREVLRWLILLECSDLMLDILLGFLALYVVDVAGQSSAAAGTAVAVWTGVGLLGDFLLIYLLRKVKGVRYLRYSAAIELVCYPLFLLTPWFWLKLCILALLGLFNAGWYSILKAQLYSELPERSGTAMAVSSFTGLVGSVIPMGIGFLAERLGLSITMWLLIVGPIALLIGLRGANGSR